MLAEINESLESPPLRYLAYGNIIPCALACTWMFNRFNKIASSLVTGAFVLVHTVVRALMMDGVTDKLVAAMDIVLFHLLASVLLPCVLIILATRLVRRVHDRVCMPYFVYEYLPLLLTLVLLVAFSESMDNTANSVMNNTFRQIYYVY